MLRRPTRSTRTDTLFPYTTLFRSAKLKDTGQRVTAESIGQALASLENLPKGIPQVDKLISALSKQTKRVQTELQPSSIADAIYALHNLGSDSEIGRAHV